jgi:hypothetical protein
MSGFAREAEVKTLASALNGPPPSVDPLGGLAES